MADRSLLLGVAQNTERLVDLHTADDIGHQAHLARGGGAVAHNGNGFLLLFSLEFLSSY